MSIIEMNEYIISVGGNKDDGLRIWNKSNYQPIKHIPNLYYNSEKLNNNKLIIGGENKLFVVDIQSFQIKINQLNDDQLGWI